MTNPRRYSIFSYRYLIGAMLFALIGIGGSLLAPYIFVQEADVFVPVTSEKVPKGLIVADMPFKSIEVRVRGLKSIIRALSRLKIRYTIDLSKANTGINAIVVRKDRIPFPKGVSILDINPDVITVKVEKEITKNLPVRISLIGKPAEGFSVVRTKADPASVMLRGPLATLGPMNEVSTRRLDITGLSGTFKKKVAIDLKENLRLVDSSETIVAHVVITERIVDKTFHGVPVIGKQTPYVYRITPPTIMIKVNGPSNLIEKLSEDSGIQAYIDLEGLNPGKYKRRATITLPVKTTLIDAKPEIFNINIAKRKIVR
jgi:YbbR domain-containing protein